jgi:hypothetical protein
MKFQIIRDDAGIPVRVNTDDGYVQSSRAFQPEEDGWMEDQLSHRDFPAIRHGDDMAALVDEVNRLRRENFHLKNECNQWRKATGF